MSKVTLYSNWLGSLIIQKGKNYFAVVSNDDNSLKLRPLSNVEMSEIYEATKTINVIHRPAISFIIMDILKKKNDYLKSSINEVDVDNLKDIDLSLLKESAYA